MKATKEMVEAGLRAWGLSSGVSRMEAALNAALALLQSSAPEWKPDALRSVFVVTRNGLPQAVFLDEALAGEDCRIRNVKLRSRNIRDDGHWAHQQFFLVPAPPSRPAARPELIAQLEANIEALRPSTGKEKAE